MQGLHLGRDTPQSRLSPRGEAGAAKALRIGAFLKSAPGEGEPHMLSSLPPLTLTLSPCKCSA